jgi:hypothetical protein
MYKNQKGSNDIRYKINIPTLVNPFFIIILTNFEHKHKIYD